MSKTQWWMPGRTSYGKSQESKTVRNQFGRQKYPALILLLFLFGLVFDGAQAWAFNTQLGPNTSLDVDTTFIYSASMRMKDASERNLGINEDDGNRSFDQWDLVSNRLLLRTEVDLHRDNIGMFARGRAFYDDVYHHSNEHDSPGTHNNGPLVGGELSDHDEFTDAVEDQHGQDLELLDLYAYGRFDLANRPLSIRFGQQVVSWGESLFTLGGISSAQSYADATMLNSPGAELQDIFLPSHQISGRYDIFENLSLAAYCQWEWDAHVSDAAGSYFSTMDYADEGGYRLLAAPGLPISADRLADNDPSDTGQYGVSLIYNADWLNATEFGLYYLNYHEKFPLVRTVPGGGTLTRDWGDPMLNFFDSLGYYLDYQEDIDLYGASFSTQVGATNISGEVSYRKDYLVQVVDPTSFLGFSYDEFDVVQALVSAIHIFGPVSFIDNVTLMFEAGFNDVVDEENLYNDDFAWGSSTNLKFSFYNVLPSVDMDIPLNFKHRPNGYSSLPGTFYEDRDEVSIGAQFLYRQVYEFGLKYVDFLGNPDEDPKSDRDYLAFTFSYTF